MADGNSGTIDDESRDKLKKLFASYASGAVSADELMTLESALRRDRQLRQDFIEYMNVDAALAEIGALTDVEMTNLMPSVDSAASDSNQPTVRDTGSRRMRLTIAASLLIAATIWVWRNRPSDSPPVARWISAIDFQLNHQQIPQQAANLSVGRYELTRGLLHLGFAGGVDVYVEAPATFGIIDSQTVVLQQGRLSAQVPPAGIGFTVRTNEAEVVDFGTEFSVEAEAGNSEVHVFKGLVQVQSLATHSDPPSQPLSLKRDQAVRIEGDDGRLIDIQLAQDRFIRSFEEPRWSYPRALKALDPVAYYRMRIAPFGLKCNPEKYSGVVLTGSGIRSEHAPGFIGAGLRISGDSIGRGARVDHPPPLSTGTLTLLTSVYTNDSAARGTALTNMTDSAGNLSLRLEPSGHLQATIRGEDGHLISITGGEQLTPQAWHQVALVVDGKTVRMYHNGQMIASKECPTLAVDRTSPLWFGCAPRGDSLWDGRLDELALFDRALTEEEIFSLYELMRDTDSDLE